MLQLLLGDRRFCGDKNAICVEDFLEILDILFSTQNLDAWVADGTNQDNDSAELSEREGNTTVHVKSESGQEINICFRTRLMLQPQLL